MTGFPPWAVADQVRQFCEELERQAVWQDWQVRQAEHALRIDFVNFLQRTDWKRRPMNTVSEGIDWFEVCGSERR